MRKDKLRDGRGEGREMEGGRDVKVEVEDGKEKGGNTRGRGRREGRNGRDVRT
jgi:hypothetical protein